MKPRAIIGSARALAALALATALAGCAGLRPNVAHRYYVLEAAAAPANEAAARRPGVLLVAPPTVAAFYDTQDLAYSRAPGLRDYYQYSSWTEPPGQRLAMLLTLRFDRSASFETVAVAGSGVKGDLLLATHLAEIYHDAAAAPGEARVTLIAELIDPRRRVLVARQTFSAAVPVRSDDAAGAAEGCARALGRVLDDVVVWTRDAAG